MYLQYFLDYGSILAGVLAFTCAGLACWRLSKVLRERSFAIAAWAMGACVVLDSALHATDMMSGFLPAALAMKYFSVRTHVYHVSSLFLFVFLVTFIVGAMYRSLAVGKAGPRTPDPASSSE